MENLRWIASVWLLLAAIPSCGSGTGGGGGQASIPLAEFPAAYVDAACSYMARCGLMPDKAACQAAISPEIGRPSAGVKAGRIEYDSQAAAACLDAVRSLSCNYSDPGGEVVPTGCRETFQGTVAGGGACFINEDCISGRCDAIVCSGGSPCCAGTCRASAISAGPVGIGGDCSVASAVCIDGAFCSTGSTPTCKAKAAVSQPCDLSNPGESCVAGAYCLPEGPDAGTCGRLPAEGQTCYSFSSRGGCDSMLDFCDEATLKCVRKIAIGGSCHFGVSCVDFAVCDSSSVCVAMGQAGQACDSSSQVGCLGALECRDEICVLPPARPICE